MFVINVISRHFLPFSLLFYALGFAQYAYISARDNLDFFGFFVWKMTQYHMSYQDFGVIRRGTIASVIKPVLALVEDGSPAEYTILLALHTIFFLAVLFMLWAVFKHVFAPDDMLGKLIKVAVAIGPLGFAQYGFEALRFDLFSALILIIATVLALRRQMIAASLTMSLGILTHEAIIFFGLGQILALYILDRQHSTASRNPILNDALFLTPIFATILVAIPFGGASIDPATVLPASVLVGVDVWFRGLFEPEFGLRPFEYAIQASFVSASYLFLILIYRANQLKPDLLMASAFVPLCLYPLGNDWSRWTHLIFVAVISVTLIQASRGKLRLDKFWVGLPLMVCALPLGPIGSAEPLPYLVSVLRILGVEV